MNSTTFSDLNLLEPIRRSVAEEGYTVATPIQAESIPHLLAGRDLLGCAQTGTGKTAAFALPILNRLADKRPKSLPGAPHVLVLSPTRELAAQIGASFESYGRHVRFRQTVIFGGVNQRPQVRALSRGAHVVVATPGRLLDLMNQGHIRLDQLEVFVLDEADRMLDMGFLPDLKRIIAKLPKKRQSLFFSATLPRDIAELAQSLLTDPVHVAITPQSTTVEQIEQRVMFVAQPNKRALLCDLLQESSVERALVFTRTKRGANTVARQLSQAGIRADAIHGNKSQSARERVLRGFRAGKLHVLVATDIAARGIDVDGLTHVINFDMPHEPESYVHRIGRTGRAGASGIAVSLCDPKERRNLRAIERLIRRTIDVHAEHPYHVAASQRGESQPKGPFRGRRGPRPPRNSQRPRRRQRQSV